MSVHKHDGDITKISASVPKKAPVPQVDREHLADLRKLEENTNHVSSQGKK
jgi:hypothetical protein